MKGFDGRGQNSAELTPYEEIASLSLPCGRRVRGASRALGWLWRRSFDLSDRGELLRIGLRQMALNAVHSLGMRATDLRSR